MFLFSYPFFLQFNTAALASPTSEHPEFPFLSSAPALFLHPSNYEPKEAQITFHSERTEKLLLPEQNRLVYTFSIQKNPTAPLLFLIPGMGGFAFNGNTLYLAEIAFNLGYSVVTLPSTTHWSFAVAASSTGRTGYLPDDSQDMYFLISVIKKNLMRAYTINPNKWGLMGYSYGALDGAFLIAQDLKQHKFNFDFLLMLNPPLNRATAIAKVDKYFADGQRWSEKRRFNISSLAIGRFIDINDGLIKIETFDQLKSAFPLKESALSWLLAREFVTSVASSAYFGDLIENKKTPSTSAGKSSAFNTSITQYLRDSVYPAKMKSTHASLKTVEAQSELLTVLEQNKGELTSHTKVVMFHSLNDFLSFPEGTPILNTLKNHKIEMKLFPFGGHMGFISDTSVVEELKAKLNSLK